MKNNSRVTNKMLQEKIENLIKLNKHPTTQEVIKTSRIKNLYRQSSAFYLWLITGILGYANKLPIVRNIIGFLSLWYGRSTWWKILVALRKAFISFNAIIGMYMVYKTTGYNTDTFLSCFYTMGQTYGEIFLNFNRRLFTWIYDLFDHKIVPNVSGNPPSNPSSWFSPKIERVKPSILSGPYTPEKESEFFTLRKLYKDGLINVNVNTTPWYKDLTTWLWFGGTIATVGIFYVGYKMFMDPLFIEDLPIIGSWFKSSPTADIANVTAITTTSPSGSITPTNIPQAEFVEGSSKSLSMIILGGIKKLNPLTWFMSSVDVEANKTAFEIAQSSQNYDNRFYPFKEIHPYDSWIKRLRISIFGEASFERNTRLAYKKEILEYLAPPLNLTPIATPSTPITPTIGTVGLGLNLTNMDTGFMTVASKLSSVTNTPTHLPVQLPEMDNAFNNPLGDALERLKGHVSPEVTSPIVESIATLLSWFFKLK